MSFIALAAPSTWPRKRPVLGVAMALMLVLVFSILPARADSVGSSFNGQCYQSSDLALAAFKQSYPQLSGGYALDLASASPAASGVLYTVTSTSLAAGTVASVSGSLTFQDCDSDVAGWFQVAPSSLIFYGLLMVSFFIGVRMGFLV